MSVLTIPATVTVRYRRKNNVCGKHKQDTLLFNVGLLSYSLQYNHRVNIVTTIRNYINRAQVHNHNYT
jgi:hypothetical protein